MGTFLHAPIRSKLTMYFCRAEAAIALRQRLNETVDLYEALRKEHAELEVKFETVERELTITKSDRKEDMHLFGARVLISIFK